MNITITYKFQDRLKGVIKHIYSHTAAHWGKAFLKEFQRAASNSQKITRALPVPYADITKAYKYALNLSTLCSQNLTWDSGKVRDDCLCLLTMAHLYRTLLFHHFVALLAPC